jgi:Arc/MetJ-type ribon-helix-helix transcriptional regulator
MTITLTNDQQKRLEREVAEGRFTSVEDAVRAAVENLLPVDTSDLAWAKPFLDEARASLAEGESHKIEDVFAESDVWLKQRGT